MRPALNTLKKKAVRGGFLNLSPLFYQSLFLILSLLFIAACDSDEKEGATKPSKKTLSEIIFLKERIKEDPNNYMAHVSLGGIYLDTGKFELAIDEHKKAILINPEDPLAYQGLGVVYSKLHKYSEAIEQYKEIIKILPRSDWTYYFLGTLYDQHGDGSNAIIHTLIAQELFTENNNLKSIADSKRNLREYFQKYGFKPEDFAQVSAPEQDSHSSGATETSEEEGQVGQGTGFLIGSKGHIITNYHVIEESTELISVTFPDGKEYSAKVISKDISNDLAILKLDKYDTKAHKSNLIIGDSTKAHIGEKVFTIGYPDISILGQQPKYSEGIIASIAGEKDDPTLFQISVPIQSGNSGGPLFNLRGEVIGVTSSGIDIIAGEGGILEGGILDIFQNVNYAVKSSLVKNLIQLLPKEAHPETTSNLGNDIPAIIDSVAPNIVFIYAE